MAIGAFARAMLTHEARALLTRLALIKPFALQEPMLPTAALLPDASVAIDRFLVAGRRELRRLVRGYLDWLQGAGRRNRQRRGGAAALRHPAPQVQRGAGAVRHCSPTSITQRSENETGVWLSGLDVVAADALALPGGYYDAPPVICYLDRGIGAAIRRARTRLPGGGEQPGRDHPRAARAHDRHRHRVLAGARGRAPGGGAAGPRRTRCGRCCAGCSATPRRRAVVWQIWERWISEIVADFWSVARVGIAATLGLMAVVSLPRAFVFRLNMDDPHPMPWIRVKLSARDRRGALPASAMAATERRLGTVLPASRHDAAVAGRAGRAAGQHAGVRLAAHQPPAEIAARPLAGGGDGDGGGASRRGCRRCTGIGTPTRRICIERPRRSCLPCSDRRARTDRSAPRTKANCSASCSRSGRCAPP